LGGIRRVLLALLVHQLLKLVAHLRKINTLRALWEVLVNRMPKFR
jgi:hypothetical protein